MTVSIAFSAPPTALLGGSVFLPWATTGGSPPGGIEWSDNGGSTWTAATGNVGNYAATSGTAYGPIILASGWIFIAIRLTGQPSTATAFQPVYTSVPWFTLLGSGTLTTTGESNVGGTLSSGTGTYTQYLITTVSQWGPNIPFGTFYGINGVGFADSALKALTAPDIQWTCTNETGTTTVSGLTSYSGGTVTLPDGGANINVYGSGLLAFQSASGTLSNFTSVISVTDTSHSATSTALVTNVNPSSWQYYNIGLGAAGSDITFDGAFDFYAADTPSTANLRASQVVEQVWASTAPPTPPSAFLGLFSTSVLPTPFDQYVEFGNPMTFNWQTALLPDNLEQRNNAMIITTVDMAFVGAEPTVTANFFDSAGGTLASSIILAPGVDTVWNGAPAVSTWNEVPWNGTASPLSPWLIEWNAPIVFKQGALSMSGTSSAGFRIGTAYLEYQILGYIAQLQSGTR